MLIINSGLLDLSMNDSTLYFYPFLHNVFLISSMFLKMRIINISEVAEVV